EPGNPALRDIPQEPGNPTHSPIFRILVSAAVVQSRILQDQLAGAATSMPPDTNKAFKAEWEALETVDYHWALEGVEDELMATDLNLEEFYIREQRLPMF
ncbi:hypothetical protein scyTo_0023388, partial [Scyliorhinus torazame]|nr:hypothetical protein [Scyliorhinus torazame]